MAGRVEALREDAIKVALHARADTRLAVRQARAVGPVRI